MVSGVQCVMTGGTLEMLQLCADNWDMMDVSSITAVYICTFTANILICFNLSVVISVS